jgi:DNA polymerase III epsilon subunit-like protein
MVERGLDAGARLMLAFVDIETTGLSPHYHEVWEVALIVDEEEHVWQLPVDLRKADPSALRVSRFYERRNLEIETMRSDPYRVAAQVAALTANRHLVGAVPSFDAAFLSSYLHKTGFKDAWHYHLIDVEALAVGYIFGTGGRPNLPWDSEDISTSIGVNPRRFDRHTALGDARWAKAIYEAVIG